MAEPQKTIATVVNHSGYAVDILWVNGAGERIPYYQDVSHGTQVDVDTYVGHKWVVQHEGTELQEFVAERGGTTIRIDGQCTHDQEVGRRDSPEKTVATIVNCSGHTINLCWVKGDGERITYFRDVAHGTKFDVQTYVGHKWVVQHEGADIQAFTAQPGGIVHRIDGQSTKDEEAGSEFTTRGSAEIFGGEVPVMAFPCVSSEAINIATYVIKSMLQDANEGVCKRLVERSASVAVIGRNQVTSDMPPHSFLKTLSTEDRRSFDTDCRGVGGTCAVPCTSVGEENVLMASDDAYRSESIQVHEFAHCVQNCGFDENLEAHLRAAFQSAILNGGHGDPTTYMMSNAEEYWAEMTQAWFEASARVDVNNGINKRDHVKRRDPPAANLLEAVYGDGKWRYIHDCPSPSKWAS